MCALPPYFLFLFCFFLGCLVSSWVGMLSTHSNQPAYLICFTRQSSAPASCFERLVHTAIFADLLFNHLWYSPAPKHSGLPVSFCIPVSISKFTVCLPHWLPFLLPVPATQPDPTVFPGFFHLRVVCKLLTVNSGCCVCLCLLGFSSCLPHVTISLNRNYDWVEQNGNGAQWLIFPHVQN